jgi:hypothetical protein
MKRHLRHAAVTAAACIASGTAAFALRDAGEMVWIAVMGLAVVFGGLCALSDE